LIPEVSTRWHGNLMGLFHERGWLKSGENIGVSPCKRDLSNDTTFNNQTSLDSPFKMEVGRKICILNAYE
jgi:hypothetical protein